MRGWVNALVGLFVVALVAAFTVSSIVAVVNTSVALQRSIDGLDDVDFIETVAECDQDDARPCFWPASGVSAIALPSRSSPAWSYDEAVAANTPTEAGRGTINVDP